MHERKYTWKYFPPCDFVEETMCIFKTRFFLIVLLKRMMSLNVGLKAPSWDEDHILYIPHE
jgi:hypothetical protein